MSHRKVTAELLKLIKQLRLVDGMTLEEVSLMTGISQGRISVLCRKDSPLPVPKIDRHVFEVLVQRIQKCSATGHLSQTQAEELLRAVKKANPNSEPLVENGIV